MNAGRLLLIVVPFLVAAALVPTPSAQARASTVQTATLGNTITITSKKVRRMRGRVRIRVTSPYGRLVNQPARRKGRKLFVRLSRRYRALLGPGSAAVKLRLTARGRRGPRISASVVVPPSVPSPSAPIHVSPPAGGFPLPTTQPTAEVNPYGSGRRYGMFEDVQYLTGAALENRLDDYARLGVHWVRFQMVWSNIASGGPAYRYWKPYDDLIAGLIARGMEPIAVLGTTPPWARPAGCSVPTCAPADTGKYGAFAAEAARRYAGRISVWEIWNEPNSRVFWKPAPDLAAYTQLLRSAYSAIKVANPSATVLTGGTAPAADRTDGAGAVTYAPGSFLKGIYDRGGQGSFDAVAHHPYNYPNLPGHAGPYDAWYEMYGMDVNLRGLMVAHGDRDKRIWATEFGAHTDPGGEGYVSEQQQAAILQEGARRWSSYEWSGPLVWYLYKDQSTDQSQRDDWFGLVRHDGTRKPAYNVFQALAGS